MTNEQEVLKPCPFCGNDTPDMVQSGTSRHSCIVECGWCGCRHESGDEGAQSGTSWNTRANDDIHDQEAAKVAELERQLAEANMLISEATDMVGEEHKLAIHWKERAEQAEQRIAESQRQKVIAWVRQHPDGALTDEFLSDDLIEPVRKASGAWKPLYRAPIVPPTVEEAVKAERESCERICWDLGQGSKVADEILDAIRARGGK